MVIHINPERINTTSGGKVARRTGARREDGEVVVVPSRAHVNFIPSPESLRTLISGAVEALRRGIFWDRGTILNLLV